MKIGGLAVFTAHQMIWMKFSTEIDCRLLIIPEKLTDTKTVGHAVEAAGFRYLLILTKICRI